MSTDFYKNTLPDGSFLTNNEKILADKKIFISLFAILIKDQITLTNKRFLFRSGRGFIIPFGYKDITASIKDIVSVKTDIGFRIILSFFAVMIILSSFVGMIEEGMGPVFLMFCFGFLLLEIGLLSKISIQILNGEAIEFYVSIWNKKDITDIIANLNSIIIEQK